MTLPWDLLMSLPRDAAEVVIVAPYIKESPLVRLLTMQTNLALLTCVTRWQVGDIASGVSDTSVRDVVLSLGGVFRLHPWLHAKYYRFGDEVLIGSANLTDAGLGVADASNFEILTRPGFGFDPTEFERELIAGSREIDEMEFQAWAAIPVVRLGIHTGADSTLMGWCPITRDPSDLVLFYEGKLVSLAWDRQDNARADLLALGIPGGLGADALRSLVMAGLLSSAFVSDVRRIDATDEDRAFRQLAQQWHVEPAEARYRAETVRSWLTYFETSS